MRTLASVTLIIVSIIHLLPLSGVLGRGRLRALYGLSISDPNLELLLRHRAVLFGLLGLFFLLAAFQPQYQPVAFVAGFISVISFLWLALSVGDYNAHLARVFRADGVALACLIIRVSSTSISRANQCRGDS